MTGLIYKDFINVWKSMRTILLLFLLICGVLSVASPGTGTPAGMLCFVACSLPITCLSLDERSGWDRFAAASPLPRWKSVMSKYLVLLFSGLGAVVVAIVLSAVGFIAKGMTPTLESMSFPLVVAGLSIAAIGLTLPFMFKFGSEKGRIFFFLVVFAICGPILVIASMGGDSINAWIAANATFAVPLLGGGLFLLVLAILTVSFLISCRIYNKKDF